MGKLGDLIRQTQVNLGAPPPLLPLPEPQGQNILGVVFNTKLGDLALMAPAFFALSDARAKVTLLVRAAAARILSLFDHPWRLEVIDENLVIPPDAPLTRWTQQKARAQKLHKRLRAQKYTLAVDFSRRWDIESRRWLVAPHRLGWLGADENLETAGLTHGIIDNRHLALRHWTKEQFRLLEPLKLSPSPLRWNLSPAALATAENFWRPGPRVLLVPGGAKAECIWPTEYFIDVAGALQRDKGAQVVVVGAPQETAVLSPMAEFLGARTYLGDDLGVLLALVQGADLVIGNDTGPIHLAFLSQKPTVAIYLGMSTVAWGPLVPDPRFAVLSLPDNSATYLPSVRTAALARLE